MICNFVCEKDAEPFDGENIVFEEVLWVLAVSIGGLQVLYLISVRLQ